MAQSRGTSAAALRDRALLELLYACEIRVSEAIALQPDDLDLESAMLRQPSLRHPTDLDGEIGWPAIGTSRGRRWEFGWPPTGRFGWLPSRAKGRTRSQIAAAACPTACSQMFDWRDSERGRSPGAWGAGQVLESWGDHRRVGKADRI